MFNWPKDKLVPPDPYTGEGEKEVQWILHLQSIANNALDAFVDTFNMKVSDINPAMNVLGVDKAACAEEIIQQSV